MQALLHGRVEPASVPSGDVRGVALSEVSDVELLRQGEESLHAVTIDGHTEHPLELASIVHWKAARQVSNKARTKSSIVVDDQRIVDVHENPQ